MRVCLAEIEQVKFSDMSSTLHIPWLDGGGNGAALELARFIINELSESDLDDPSPACQLSLLMRLITELRGVLDIASLKTKKWEHAKLPIRSLRLKTQEVTKLR